MCLCIRLYVCILSVIVSGFDVAILLAPQTTNPKTLPGLDLGHSFQRFYLSGFSMNGSPFGLLNNLLK